MTELPADHKRVIKRAASKIFYRLNRMGIYSCLPEDIEQELWIFYMRCKELYREVEGVPFIAYLANGLKMQERVVMRNALRDRQVNDWAVKIDTPVGENGEDTIGSILPSPDPTPDEIVSARLLLRTVKRRLSPRARTFVSLLVDQPPALIEELRALKERADFAKSKGVRFTSNARLTTSIVFKLMGADRQERKKIMREVENLGKNLVTA